MKSEEILYSLEHVGEDLIGAAEQTVVARRRRPWLKIAAAAVLSLVVVGGAVGLLLHGKTIQAGNTDPDATEDTNQYPGLPLLTVSGNCKGDTGCVSTDEQLAVILQQNDAWREVVKAGTMPVYVDEAIPEGSDVMTYYSQAQLRDRLQRAAERCGLTITDEPIFAYCRELVVAVIPGEDEPVSAASVQTDHGILVAAGDGSISLHYNYTPDTAETGSAEQIVRSMLDHLGFLETDNYALTWAQIQLPYCSNYGYYAVSWHCEEPEAQFYSSQFRRIRLLTVNGRSLCGFSSTLFGAEESTQNAAPGHYTPESWTFKGNYPVISPEEAKACVRSGQFLMQLAVKDMEYSDADLERMELVYLAGFSNRTLLPFYRFWIRNEAISADEYAFLALYVPAVNPDYLKDFPAGKTSPEDPDETVPDTTEPDVTETDGKDPRSSNRPEPVDMGDGTYEIVGPDGRVPALQYLGRTCIDPVWADLDGDGQEELVYWCDGPTSGFFTVAICVYGLEDGFPVVKASQIYNLTWNSVSLERDENGVWFCLEPVPTAPEQTPQRLSVTLKDGTVVLGGGKLPPDIELWGDQPVELGVSFDELKKQVADRSLINHWACLVWTEGSDVLAAVTNNSRTVTGVIRYQLREDGTWDCSSQGVEPIAPVENAESLVGFSMEDLTQRLGPCHFDMGSGVYIPCWFTKDCGMLEVSAFDTVSRAEQKDLRSYGTAAPAEEWWWPRDESGKPILPEDTDLEFWITQDVAGVDFSGYDQIDGWFGAREYLGAGYHAVRDENGMRGHPERYVSYVVTAYPDYADGGQFVTTITITDPTVRVWGVTADMPVTQIDAALRAQGFTVVESTDVPSSVNMATFERLSVIYGGGTITIRVEIENREGIVY